MRSVAARSSSEIRNDVTSRPGDVTCCPGDVSYCHVFYKLMLSFHEKEMFDPANEQIKIESYLANSDCYFSVIYVRTADNRVKAITLYTGNSASDFEVAEFEKLAFREEIIKMLSPPIFYVHIESRFLDRIISANLLGNVIVSGGYTHHTITSQYFPPTEMKERELRLPQGYELGTVDRGNIHHMAYYYGEDLIESRVMTRSSINKNTLVRLSQLLMRNTASRPYCAVFHNNETQPVAWVTTHFDGLVGALHVDGHHRRKGLARALIRELYRKMKDGLGVGPPVGIGDENVASIRLFESEGWVKQPAKYKRIFLAA